MPDRKNCPGTWVRDWSVTVPELSVATGSVKVITLPRVPSGVSAVTSIAGRQTGGASSTV